MFNKNFTFILLYFHCSKGSQNKSYAVSRQSLNVFNNFPAEGYFTTPNKSCVYPSIPNLATDGRPRNEYLLGQCQHNVMTPWNEFLCKASSKGQHDLMVPSSLHTGWLFQCSGSLTVVCGLLGVLLHCSRYQITEH